MQRFVNPIVHLQSMQQLEKFKDVNSGVWKEDQKGTLLLEGELDQNIDRTVNVLGFNTRVVAYITESDYQENYKALSKAAENLAHRTNLRVGIITDSSIISQKTGQIKKCLNFNQSQLAIFRWDNKCFTLNLDQQD